MVEFTTNRLSLGELIDSDVDVLVDSFNNPKIKKGLNNVPDGFNENMAHQFIQSQHYTRENNIAYYFAVRLGDELVGTICLYNFKENSAEIGYWIAEKHWGNGYATESSKAVIDYANKVMGITHINGTTKRDNKASQNVLKKLGMGMSMMHKQTILYTLIQQSNAR